MNIALRSVTAADTRDLRHRVLRPNQPVEAAVYPLDEQEDAAHFGAFDNSLDGDAVGVASIFREAQGGGTDTAEFRVRGMAVVPASQGGGIGRRLLQACVDHARSLGGSRVWCNARVTAADFYEHCGFAQRGDDFDLPPLGPHRVMVLELSR